MEGACEGRYYMTTGQQWEGVNDVVSICERPRKNPASCIIA